MCHGTVMCAMAVLHPSGRPGWRPGGLVRAAQRPTMLLRAIRPRARAAGGVGCGRGVPQAGARDASKHIYHAVRTRAAKRPPLLDNGTPCHLKGRPQLAHSAAPTSGPSKDITS